MTWGVRERTFWAEELGKYTFASVCPMMLDLGFFFGGGGVLAKCKI